MSTHIHYEFWYLGHAKSIVGKSPYLECRLFPWRWIPILAIPLLKANCPILRTPSPSVSPSLRMPSSRQHNIYLYTDDINTPNSSCVRHCTDSVNNCVPAEPALSLCISGATCCVQSKQSVVLPAVGSLATPVELIQSVTHCSLEICSSQRSLSTNLEANSSRKQQLEKVVRTSSRKQKLETAVGNSSWRQT